MKVLMTGKSSPLVLIQSIYKSLTKSEQKVADFVLKDTEGAIYSTVTDLAEKSNVGETTVLRFCRKLGYRGFQEFKLSIAQALSNSVEQVHGKIQEDDGLSAILAKITQQNVKALQDSMEILQLDSLQNATDAINGARKIYFFGIGSSGLTAHDAKLRFMRLGFNVDHSSDSHIMAMTAALTDERDVVVGISSSGSTKDLVDAIKIAKENKAFVICITNHARSPVTQYADIILLAASKETPLQGGAFSSKIAQLHLLDILTTITAFENKGSTFEAIEKTAKSVLDKMY